MIEKKYQKQNKLYHLDFQPQESQFSQSSISDLKLPDPIYSKIHQQFLIYDERFPSHLENTQNYLSKFDQLFQTLENNKKEIKNLNKEKQILGKQLEKINLNFIQQNKTIYGDFQQQFKNFNDKLQKYIVMDNYDNHLTNKNINQIKLDVRNEIKNVEQVESRVDNLEKMLF